MRNKLHHISATDEYYGMCFRTKVGRQQSCFPPKILANRMLLP